MGEPVGGLVMGVFGTSWEPRWVVVGVLAFLLAAALPSIAATAAPAPPERPAAPADTGVSERAALGADGATGMHGDDAVGAARAPAGPALPDPRVVRILRTPVAGTTARAPDGQPTVALTIDDGPDPVWTPQVLALLRSDHVVATFCMIGQLATARPDLVREVVAAGMRLCDHTRDHDQRLRSRPPAVLDAEVTGAQKALQTVSGAPVPYYRSPGGGWSPGQLDVAVADGMQPLGWSVDPQDWRRPGIGAIVDRVEHRLRPGGIVLLHDGGGDRSQTVASPQRLLPWLHDHGYVTVFPTP